MRRPTILRIGVCGCSPCYHGKLAGCSFSISRLAGFKLRQPRMFQFREVVVSDGPNRLFRQTLRRFRCHFFLDLHRTYDLGYRVTLKRNFFYNGPGKTCRVLIGGGFMDNDTGKFYDEWEQRRPSNPRVVVARLKRMLGSFKVAELDRWLAGTTPIGWRPPQD